MKSVKTVLRKPCDHHDRKDQKHNIHNAVNVFLCLFLFINRKPEIHGCDQIKNAECNQIDRYMNDINDRRDKNMVALYHHKDQCQPRDSVKLFIRLFPEIESACQCQIAYCEKN